MTLQPPPGYGSENVSNVPAPEPISPPLSTMAESAGITPGLAPDSPAQEISTPLAAPEKARDGQSQTTESDARHALIPGPARPLSSPPQGLSVVGGARMRLRKAVALDRVASGYGALTITWTQRRQGLDLIALSENSSVTTRGNSIVVDLSQPLHRVLIGTGTRGSMALPPSDLMVTNGATQIVVPILGGTSLGVWPRLSISKVGEFVVIRHELDPLSGMLNAVANAYGYDERSFLLAHTT